MENLTPEKFFLETPLYKIINFTMEDAGIIENIVNFIGKFDGPCVNCGKETTYKLKVGNHNHIYYSMNYLSENMTYDIKFCCSREESHAIEIFYKIIPSKFEIFKIGQYPSIASLMKGEITKYRKILGSNYKEFSKGIGLISHGIGIGSFVYLRRVFENLIDEAYQLSILNKDRVEDDYSKSRMDDKIVLLKEYLPEFLVKNKVLYGILSKGIHELTEEECLENFHVVKLGIELILDEKIKQKEQEAKIKEGERLLNDFAQKIKTKSM